MKHLGVFLLALLFAGQALADSEGSVTGGSRAPRSTLGGCAYNSSAPTLTNGQQVGLQCDVNGKLITNATGGGGTSANVGVNGATAPTSSNLPGYIDGSGNLQPIQLPNFPLPVIQYSAGVPVAVSSPAPVVLSQNGPNNVTFVQGTSGDIAANTAAASLTSAVGKTASVSLISVTGSGATAGLTVACSLSGVLGGTQTIDYSFSVGATVPNPPLVLSFSPPFPASATNTAITMSCPSGGSGALHVAVNIWGQLN